MNRAANTFDDLNQLSLDEAFHHHRLMADIQGAKSPSALLLEMFGRSYGLSKKK